MIKTKKGWVFYPPDTSNYMHTLKLGTLYFPGPGVCYYSDANTQDTHDHFNITDYIDYYISYFICFLLLLKLRHMHQTQTHPR